MKHQKLKNTKRQNTHAVAAIEGVVGAEETLVEDAPVVAMHSKIYPEKPTFIVKDSHLLFVSFG